MCDRCKEIERFFQTAIQECEQKFPPDKERHMAAVLAKNPDLDREELRQAFASQADHFSSAHACVRVAVEYLLSAVNYDTVRAGGLIVQLIMRSEARRQELLTMQSGASGGIPITPSRKPDGPDGAKPH